MGGRSRLEATDQQRETLKALVRSGARGEADRARAVLLPLDGWSSAAIVPGAAGAGLHGAA
jgi:hypothetical protein